MTWVVKDVSLFSNPKGLDCDLHKNINERTGKKRKKPQASNSKGCKSGC